MAGRIGTGLVLAKTEDGMWSAPSAIATVGLGWGALIGGEITDFVLVLNTDSAVEAFSGEFRFSCVGQDGLGCGAVFQKCEVSPQTENCAVARRCEVGFKDEALVLVSHGAMRRREGCTAAYVCKCPVLNPAFAVNNVTSLVQILTVDAMKMPLLIEKNFTTSDTRNVRRFCEFRRVNFENFEQRGGYCEFRW